MGVDVAQVSGIEKDGMGQRAEIRMLVGRGNAAFENVHD